MVVDNPVGNVPAPQQPTRSPFRGINHFKWLSGFRRATPRAEREALIQSTPLVAALETTPKVPGMYMLAIYIAAAQVLEGTLPQWPVQEIAQTFGVPAGVVRKKCRRMTSKLERDAKDWAARKATTT